MMRLRLSIVLALLLSASVATAETPREIRWGDELTDTIAVQQMLAEIVDASDSADPQDYMIASAMQLMSRPYAAGTLERQPERLTIRLDSLDCTTFVETVSALSRCAAQGRLLWRDFASALQDMRYRDGIVDGYASRLHYISDWAADNARRGNLVEATAEMPGSVPMAKTLDFMSSHRGSYPALADDEELARIKAVEAPLHDLRYWYIPKAAIGRALPALLPGDIIAITTSIAGLDTQHIGLLTTISGEPRLLHASSRMGRVVIDPRPLADYLNSSRSIIGIRVFRLLPVTR